MHWGRCQGREGQLGLLCRGPNPAQHSWVLESRPEADGRQAAGGREVLTRHAATTGDCWDTAHNSPRTPLAGTPKQNTPCRLSRAWSPLPTGNTAPKWCWVDPSPPG